MAEAPSGPRTDRVAAALLGAAAVAVAFPKWTTLSPGGVPVQLSDVMVLGATLFWLVGMRGRRLAPSRLYLPLALYLAAALISLVEADQPARSLVKIAGIGSLMAALVVGLHVLGTRAAWQRVADLWVASALASAAVAAAGIALHVLGVTSAMIGPLGSLPHLSLPRVEGTFLNSNMLCDYLGVSAMLLVARGHDYLARFGRVKVVIAALPLVAVLPFTMSPALGALAVAIAVLAAIGPTLGPDRGRVRLRPWRFSIVAAFALVAAFFLLTTVLSVAPRGQGMRVGPVDIAPIPSVRVENWRASWRTYLQHPLTGTGVGERVARYKHAYAGIALKEKPVEFFAEAHNAYLGLLAQMGPLALIAYLLLLWRLVDGIRSGLRPGVGAGPGTRAGLHGPEPADGANPDPWLRPALVAGMIGLVAYAALFGGLEDGRHLWLFFALVAAAPAAFNSSSTPLRREPPPVSP